MYGFTDTVFSDSVLLVAASVCLDPPHSSTPLPFVYGCRGCASSLRHAHRARHEGTGCAAPSRPCSRWICIRAFASPSQTHCPGADGTVFTWGKGEYGCLGHGEDLSNQLLPKKIEAWAQE